LDDSVHQVFLFKYFKQLFNQNEDQFSEFMDNYRSQQNFSTPCSISL
ncbi:MAG: hypothetical protein ACI8RP_000561, partial [Urechidicola sp.]